MSISRRLEAHRQAVASAQPKPKCTPLTGPDDETDEIEDDETLESKPEKDKDMTTEEQNAAIAAARKEGFDAASARFTAVISSGNYAGRETLAQTLLATDLTAEQIDAALAAANPAPVAAADPAADPDAAARADMAAAIGANRNSEVEAGGGDLPVETAEAKAITDGFAKGAAFANQINGHPA